MNPALPNRVGVDKERKSGVNYAIILAGGSGTRFWPLSRQAQPKQFIRIFSNKTIFEDTVFSIRKLISDRNIYVATNKNNVSQLKRCLKKFNLPSKNLLFEPISKNNLGPIALLSLNINRQDPEAVVIVTPCDNFIKQKNKFLKALKLGIDAATDGYIVTLGTLPTRPETGYGYIKIKSKVKSKKSKVYEVDEFIEKPDLRNAKRFLRDKSYFWNAGVFIFRPDVMLAEIKKFRPEVYKIVIQMGSCKDFRKLWQRLPSISLDYAIMQRCKKIAMVATDYEWIDLGSWRVVEEMSKKDKNNNIFKGNSLDIGSRNCIVWAGKRLVATLGLNDTVIVDTKDALLICAKDRIQDVRKIVQLLKVRNIKGQI